MCSSYIINGKRIDSIGELKRFFQDMVPFDCRHDIDVPIDDSEQKAAKDYPDNTCLCPVNIQKVANMMGQDVVYDGVDFYFGKDGDNIKEEDICDVINPERKKKDAIKPKRKG